MNFLYVYDVSKFKTDQHDVCVIFAVDCGKNNWKLIPLSLRFDYYGTKKKTKKKLMGPDKPSFQWFCNELEFATPNPLEILTILYTFLSANHFVWFLYSSEFIHILK